MKVLDLQCPLGHTFEGWFGSEEDFVNQSACAMITCPLCGDASVVKKLSAPRLQLASKRIDSPVKSDPELAPPKNTDLTAALLAMAHHIISNSKDVGSRFAEEARKMHYGEKQESSIRGVATLNEARSLAEEGIAVMPLLLPSVVTETLQ
jgi:hypothetical protein